MLSPQVHLVSDGGGLAPAPRKTITGWDLVSRALLTFADRLPPEPTITVESLNGGPATAVRSAGNPAAVVFLHLIGGLIADIHLISNPEKLSGAHLPASCPLTDGPAAPPAG